MKLLCIKISWALNWLGSLSLSLPTSTGRCREGWMRGDDENLTRQLYPGKSGPAMLVVDPLDLGELNLCVNLKIRRVKGGPSPPLFWSELFTVNLTYMYCFFRFLPECHWPSHWTERFGWSSTFGKNQLVPFEVEETFGKFPLLQLQWRQYKRQGK